MNLQEMLKNYVFNPTFTNDLAMWSHHGDVEVAEWPEPLPEDGVLPARTWLGNAVALGPSGELGQFVNLPVEHDLYFVIKLGENETCSLTVTVEYADGTEEVHAFTEADIQTADEIGGTWAFVAPYEFGRIEVPLNRDPGQRILSFTLRNDAMPSAAAGPVYVGMFVISLDGPWVAFPRPVPSVAYFAPLLMEAFAHLEPQTFRSGHFHMSDEGRLLSARMFRLERQFAQVMKRLGMEQPRRPGPAKAKPAKAKPVTAIVAKGKPARAKEARAVRTTRH